MLCDLDVILHLWIVLSFRISMSNRRNKVNNNHYHSMRNTIRYWLFFFQLPKRYNFIAIVICHGTSWQFFFRSGIRSMWIVPMTDTSKFELEFEFDFVTEKYPNEKKPTSCIIYILIYLLCIWILQKCSIIVEILLLLASLSRVSFAVCIWPGIALLRSGSGLEITDRPTDWHRLVKHTFFF